MVFFASKEKDRIALVLLIECQRCQETLHKQAEGQLPKQGRIMVATSAGNSSAVASSSEGGDESPSEEAIRAGYDGFFLQTESFWSCKTQEGIG